MNLLKRLFSFFGLYKEKNVVLNPELFYVFNTEASFDIYEIRRLVNDGCNKFGLKFHVEFRGSKGYLDAVYIGCEGFEPVKILPIVFLRPHDLKLYFDSVQGLTFTWN